MAAAVSIVMALAAAAAIIIPFFREVRPQPRRVTKETPASFGFGRELDGDLRAGIITKDEYDELTRGSASETPAGGTAGRARTPEALESDIERRVRELRQTKGGAPRTAPQKPSPRPAIPSQGAAKKSSVCPKCGRPYKQGDRFCTSCGARLTGGAR